MNSAPSYYDQSIDPLKTGALPVNMQALCDEFDVKKVDYKMNTRKQLLEV
jgi:hypothetical protein